MTENNNELPEINKRIRDIIDNDFNGNVLKFSKYIGLNSSSKINRLFSKDKRNNEYPDVSVDIIQRIANSLNYSADDIIFGFEKNNKQKHVNNINIEANHNNVKGDNNIVSTKDSNIQLDQHIKQLLDLIQIQQMQINNLISSKNIT